MYFSGEFLGDYPWGEILSVAARLIIVQDTPVVTVKGRNIVSHDLLPKFLK